MKMKARRAVAIAVIIMLLQNLFLPALLAESASADGSGQGKAKSRVELCLERYGDRLSRLPAAIQARYRDFVQKLNKGGGLPDAAHRSFLKSTAGTALPAAIAMTQTAQGFTFPPIDRGDAPPDAADLALGGLTEATPLLRRQADLLGKDPVQIYNYLRQHIRHHPYPGAARDAETVLEEGAGNDLDQTTLCLALLRLSGIPCRYATGEVTAPAGAVRAWLGADNNETALKILGEAGVAAELVQEPSGQAIRFRHYWARAYLSYLPHRGASPGAAGGEIWVDIDPSWKRLQPRPVQNLGAELGLEGGSLLARLRAKSKLTADSAAEVPKAEIDEAIANWTAAVMNYAAGCGLGADSLAGIAGIDAPAATVLPASLPYAVSGRQTWSGLPPEMEAAIAVGVDGVSSRANLGGLKGEALSLSYRPATPDDAAVFEVYRDEAEFPAFLVRLRPVLTVGGREVWAGAEVEMGRAQTVSIAVGACGREWRGETRVAAGSLHAVLPRFPGQGLMDLEHRLARLKSAAGREGVQGTIALLAGLACAWDHESGLLLAVAAKQAGLTVGEGYGAVSAGLGLTVTEAGGLPFTARADKTLLSCPVAHRRLLPAGAVRAAERLAEAWPGLLDAAAAESALKGAFGLPGVSSLELLARANDLKIPAYLVTAANLEAVLAKLPPDLAAVLAPVLRAASGGGKAALIPCSLLTLAGWQGGAAHIIGPGLLNVGSVLPEGAAAVAPAEGISAPELIAGILGERREAFMGVKLHRLRQFPEIAAGLAMTYLPSLILVGSWFKEAEPDPLTWLSAAIALGAAGSQYVDGIEVVGARGYPSLFSPNGDGLLDTVTVFAGLSQEADWTLEWRSMDGTVRRTYTGRGTAVSQTWDGRDEASTLLPDGEYQFNVTAARGEARSCRTGTAVLDLTPPAVEIARPAAGAVSGLVAIFGRADDLHFSSWAAEYGPGDAPAAWTRIASGGLPVIDNILCHWDTSSAANGRYTLRVWARDAAGNRAEARVPVNVDNPVPDTIPPTVAILSPTAGQVSGIVPLRISTSDEQRVTRLELYAGNDTVRIISDPPAIYEFAWDTAEVLDGTKVLRARAFDAAGNAGTAEVSLSFNNGISGVTYGPNPFDPDDQWFLARGFLPSPANWTVEIRSAVGEKVTGSSGQGTELLLEWNGVTPDGYWPGDGEYTLVMASGPYRLERKILVSRTPGPVVGIASPADGSVLTGPAEVTGRVLSGSLREYTLSYRRIGGDAWHEFAKGYTVVNGAVLGTFDTTMLANGPYELRLTAVDDRGFTTSAQITVAVDGELKVGNLHLEFEDLSVSLGSLPISVIRRYDTLYKAEDGELGHGWKMAVRNADITQDASYNLFVMLPDGRRTRFAFTPYSPGAGVIGPYCLAYPRYKAVAGVRAALECLDVPVVVIIDGEYYMYDGEMKPFAPREFKLTTGDGLVYYLDKDLGVTKVVEPNGAYLLFTAGGITHSSGKTVSFGRDGAGRITTLTGPDGGVVRYEYDPAGDLVAVTDPAGNRISFVYTDHALTGIFGPDGKQLSASEYDQSGRLKVLYDAAGNKLEIIHDLAARRETIVDRMGNATTYGYDEHGWVTEKIDALGNEWHYSYDGDGNKLMESDPDGNVTYYNYDAYGNVTAVTDALGNVTRTTYATGLPSRDLPATTTDALGRVTRYAYDSRGNLKGITDALGNSFSLTISTNGLLESFTDPTGAATSFTNDPTTGLPLTMTDALGNVTTYTYDSAGRVLSETKQRKKADGTVENLITAYEYDAAGRLVKTTYPDSLAARTEYDELGRKKAEIDRAGRRTEYTYDEAGNLQRVDYPDGTYEEYGYDRNGNKTSVRDRSGRVTQYVYDALNRQVKTIYPDGTSSATGYDALGRVIAQTDQRGNTSRQEYDSLGRVVKSIDPLGNTTEYTYDAAGNQLTTKDSLGNVTTNTYDANNRLTKVTYADGTSVSYAYDANGRRISQIDQNGYETKYGYDTLGRLISVTDALGGVTRYEYNESGRMTAQIDALGRTTRFAYDTLGRLIEKTLPLGQKEYYSYNTDGTLKTKTDFNGHVTTYAYDPVTSRLLAKTYQDGTSASYAYYPDGFLKTATAPGGLTTSYEYDNMGRLAKVTNPYGQAIEYRYDEAGNRKELIAPHGTVSFTFDELNRINTVTDQGGRVTRYTYDALSRLARTEYGNGTETIYTYDALSRLKEL
ncbi:MAG: transglutaminase domain-containing protein, partial [Patescibacteria group bacterium]